MPAAAEGGCLRGYSVAVLSHLGAHVTGIDSDDALIRDARDVLSKLHVQDADVQKAASLADGYPKSAPYDVVVIEGAIDTVPESVVAQMAVGGRLVAVKNLGSRPGTRGGTGRGMLAGRIGGALQYREHFDAPALPLPGFQRIIPFVF